MAPKDFAILDEMTDYFEEYKLQKLTNKVHASFVEKVEAYANTRPYNKLQPRSLVISHIQGKEKIGLFVRDTLGDCKRFADQCAGKANKDQTD